MKTHPSPLPAPALKPSLARQRQLCIAFDAPVLLGASPEHRSAATQALAALLMQAAGVHKPEGDDVQP